MRHRFIERLISETHKELFPTPSKFFPVILDRLHQLNSIFVEDDRTTYFLTIQTVIYLCRLKSPTSAEQLYSKLEKMKAEGIEAQFWMKYTEAVLYQAKGDHEYSIVKHLDLILQLHQKIKDEEKHLRFFVVLLLLAHFEVAHLYMHIKQFKESIKYCNMGIEIFENTVEDLQSDQELRTIYSQLSSLMETSEEEEKRIDRIEMNLKKRTMKKPHLSKLEAPDASRERERRKHRTTDESKKRRTLDELSNNPKHPEQQYTPGSRAANRPTQAQQQASRSINITDLNKLLSSL